MAKTITLRILSDATTASSCQIKTVVQADAEQVQSESVFTLSSLSDVLSKAAQWKEQFRQYIPVRGQQFRSGIISYIEDEQVLESDLYEAYDKSKRELFESFNEYLDSEALKNWLKSTLESTIEPVRIIIQTDSIDLAALPWEQWSFWDDYYDKNDLVVALNFFDKENSILPSSLKVLTGNLTRILVLLGDESNDTNQNNKINLDFDKDEFEKFEADINKLGNRANVDICVAQPNRSELEKLLKEVWHVIYYGGHSKTLEAEKDGILYLRNQTQVKISELEAILKQNLDRGDLRLLVANACQGLGTALRLVLLGLPNVIVMRESIPDDIAHDFLRYLLESFVIGLPITSAIQHCKPHLRQAYDIRHELPGASLLPALCLTLNAVNEVDFPVIPLTGLHPICQEMRALANFAKARLTLENAKDVAALHVQEYYANRLQLKNKITDEDATIEVEKIFCSPPRILGKEIWEVDFLATVFGETLIWGQGFVNIKNGSSELLLDVRPWSWIGEAVTINGQEIKQLSLNANDVIDLHGKPQKATFTKRALCMLEEEYSRYVPENTHHKYATKVENFGGWLKDVNKKKFLKQLVTLKHQNVSKKEAQNQDDKRHYAQTYIDKSYSKTPFGRARDQLGITEFNVELPEEKFVPLTKIMQQDEWTERDAEDLLQEGITEEQWENFWVPQYIVVSVAKRPYTNSV